MRDFPHIYADLLHIYINNYPEALLQVESEPLSYYGRINAEWERLAYLFGVEFTPSKAASKLEGIMETIRKVGNFVFKA